MYLRKTNYSFASAATTAVIVLMSATSRTQKTDRHVGQGMRRESQSEGNLRSSIARAANQRARQETHHMGRH